MFIVGSVDDIWIKTLVTAFVLANIVWLTGYLLGRP